MNAPLQKASPDLLDGWLAAPSRAELAWQILDAGPELSLPQARRIVARLDQLAAPAQRLRLGVLHTFTSDLLDPWLQLECALQDLGCDLYHAPYGYLRQEAQAGSGLAAHAPDLTLVLLRREDLHPALAEPVAALDPAAQGSLAEAALEAALAIVEPLRAAVGGQIAIAVLPPFAGPGLGLFDAASDRSEGAWWSGWKTRLAAALRERVRSSQLLDLDEALAQVGRERFFDARFWHASRYPFSATGGRELARRVAALGALLKRPRAKVIVLDADNTLWGGVIGEDGIDGIALGPDYPGSAYLAFQRRLLDFQQRGFVLAMCSKNNDADVDQVLRDHPHQLLREEHFVARRVNWLPKPQNLEALAEELNVGLDSFVFVDDSEHECLAVRRALPQVQVVRTPAHPLAVPGCLDRVARLEVLALTAEDRAKTQMYAQERQRKALAREFTDQGGDFTQYLRSLDMKMQVVLDDARQITRQAQLTQKTNQFNLTTRRYAESDLRAMLDSGQSLVAHFSLADRFGNSGVVGLAIFRQVQPACWLLDTFLMSCRVIGRGAESVFLETLLGELAARGADRIEAEFIPTAKNALAAGFLGERGFVARDDGRLARSLAQQPARGDTAPIAVELLRPGR